MNLETLFMHFCTFQVMVLIGAVLVVMEQYLPYAMERTRRKRHVLLMGYSYVALLLITLSGVYMGVFFHPAPLHEMRLYALLSVYGASDFGLYYIFDYLHHMNHEESRNKVPFPRQPEGVEDDAD